MVRAGAIEVALSGRTQDGGRTQRLQGHGAEVGNLSLFPPSIPTHYQAQEVRGLDSLAESLVIQSISTSGAQNTTDKGRRCICAEC